MYSAEVLSQLRSLNWLADEIRRVPPGSREEGLLQAQVESVRARLPSSILGHHDRLALAGKLSTVEVQDGSCGGCHMRLTPELLADLATPGRFGVCPSCGLFLWSAEAHAADVQPPSNLSGQP